MLKCSYYTKKWKWKLVKQLCPTLCNSMDCSLLSSSVHGFSTQKYWSGLPFPSPWYLLDLGIKPGSPALQADSLPVDSLGKPIHTTQSNLQIQCNSHQNNMKFSTELEQIILKFVWSHRKTSNSQNYLEKEEQGWAYHASWFQTVAKLQESKSIVVAQKQTYVNQWKRIESPEISSHTHSQLTYEKGGKDIQWERNSLFNKWCGGGGWTATFKRTKLENFLIP